MKIVKIQHDTENPMSNDDGQWKLYSFCTRHNSFKSPSDLGLGALKDGEPTIRNPGLRQKMKVGLAFFLSYFEHGNCLWFRKGTSAPAGVEFQWDGTRIAGLLVWEHDPSEIGAKTYEDRAKDADAFLNEYTAWSNGETYCYSITDEETGEDVDCCGGFIGTEYMVSEIASSLKGDDFEVKGDCDWLAGDIRVKQKATEKVAVPA